MVSPRTSAEYVAPRHAMNPRAERALHSRLDPFPRTRGARWLLRLALSAPLVAVALVMHAAGDPVATTPNAALLDRVATIDWAHVDAAWLGQIFPPIGTFLGVVIPGGRLGLAIAGVLAAGVFVQKLFEIMVQRHFHPSTSVILTIALTLNPIFFYTALEDLSGFLGLMFFGLAAADVVRFVTWGNTQAGFRAGLWFMLAALTDLSAVFFVLAAIAVAPFLDLGRHHRTPGARASTLLVIAFPTVAGLASLMLLNLMFLHAPLGSVGRSLLGGADERLAGLPEVFASGGWLLLAPVVSAWLVALIVGRWTVIPASTLIFASVMAAYVLGLQNPASAGTVFIMMTLLAMAFIPTARRPVTTALLDLVAIAQIAIAWLAAFSSPILFEWMSALASALVGTRH